MMTVVRTRSGYRCAACGAAAPQWVGRCPSCREWNSLQPGAGATGQSGRAGPVPVPVGEVPWGVRLRLGTGVAEVDRVLGGGLVEGSVSLLGGEPGIGKSTLLVQLAASLARLGSRVLYVTAEESAGQVRARAERLNAVVSGFDVLADTAVERIASHVATARADVVVVDSIQAVTAASSSSPPGSPSQVRECAHTLAQAARTSSSAVILVGHVTKDGSLAGPRQLEHLVDTVLSFEGDRRGDLRMLRAVKHRFGACAEMGLFAMAHEGLVEVPDASGRFLADRVEGMAGSAVTASFDGRRPLLAEVQALLGPASSSSRRAVQGLVAGRVSLLVAVLEARLGLPVAGREVFVAAAGGARLVEPATDLAVVLALASAVLGRPLPADIVAWGEVGLAGEVRAVNGWNDRVREARRLGFEHVVVPAVNAHEARATSSVRVSPVRTAADALQAAHLLDDVAAARRRRAG